MARKPISVAFVSQKGGSGKSSIAASIALLLARWCENEERQDIILCIDTDVRTASLTSLLLGNPKDVRTFLDLFLFGPRMEIVQNLIFMAEPPDAQHFENLVVVPARRAGEDEHLIYQAYRLGYSHKYVTELFKKFFELLVGKVSLILVDLPPLTWVVNPLLQGVVKVMDYIVYVAEPVDKQLAGLQETIRLVNKLTGSSNGKMLALFLNRVTNEYFHPGLTWVELIEKYFNVSYEGRDPRKPGFWMIPHDDNWVRLRNERKAPVYVVSESTKVLGRAVTSYIIPFLFSS